MTIFDVWACFAIILALSYIYGKSRIKAAEKEKDEYKKDELLYNAGQLIAGSKFGIVAISIFLFFAYLHG